MLRDGQVIDDRYTVLGPLLDLGAATLYRVQDATTGEVLVLEVPWHPVSELRLAQVHAARGLGHPNVIAFRGIVRSGELLGFLSEEHPGPSLARLLAGGRLPTEVADAVARGVLAGVAALHDLGVAPVWPLPETVRISVSGRAYIPKLRPLFAMLDAEGVEDTVARYLAPEVVEGEANIDGRADVFAVGALLYELACGAKAFDGATVVDVYRQSVTASFSPPRRIARDVPARMDRAIIGALVPERDLRVGTVHALIAEWARLDAPVDMTPTMPPVSVGPPAGNADLWMEEVAATAYELPAAGPATVTLLPVSVEGIAWLLDGPHPFADVAGAFRGLLEELVAIHRRGDAHGRLAPQGLVLERPEGGVGFAGARVARRAGVDADDESWRGWAAPERARLAHVSPRGDVFTVAALLWTGTTGQLPPLVDLPVEERQAILRGGLVDVAPEIVDVMVLCLDADPGRRLADARALGVALYGPLFGPTGTTTVPPTARTQQPATPRAEPEPEGLAGFARRYRLLTPVLVAAALFVVGGGAVSMVVNGFEGSSAAAQELAAWESGDTFLLVVAASREPILARLAAVGADAERLDLLADAAEHDPSRAARLQSAVAFTDGVMKEVAAASQLSRSQRNEVELQLKRLRTARDTWIDANERWADALDISGQIAVAMGRAAPPVELEQRK